MYSKLSEIDRKMLRLLVIQRGTYQRMNYPGNLESH